MENATSLAPPYTRLDRRDIPVSKPVKSTERAIESLDCGE